MAGNGRMYAKRIFSALFCAGLLIGSSVSKAEDQGPRLWPAFSYTLLSYQSGDDAKGEGSRIERLLQRTLEDAPADTVKPLMEGWVFPETYSRIYADRQVYFVLHRSTSKVPAQVCRVVIEELPSSTSTPDIISFGRGTEWCREPGRIASTPGEAKERPKSPQGQSGASTLMRAADGKRLEIRHIVNVPQYGTPTLPTDVATALTAGRFPGPRDETKPANGSLYAYRDLYLFRLPGALWGMAIKFNQPFGASVSACFVRSADKAKAIPNRGWITPEIEGWCREKVDSYLASLPADRIPKPAPIARVSPRIVQDESDD